MSDIPNSTFPSKLTCRKFANYVQKSKFYHDLGMNIATYLNFRKILLTKYRTLLPCLLGILSQANRKIKPFDCKGKFLCKDKFLPPMFDRSFYVDKVTAPTRCEY